MDLRPILDVLDSIQAIANQIPDRERHLARRHGCSAFRARIRTEPRPSPATAPAGAPAQERRAR